MSTPAPSRDQPKSTAPDTVGEALRRFWAWCTTDPLAAALLIASLGTLVWFFCGYKPIGTGDPHSIWRWAREAWNEGNDLEHGPLILPGAIVVAWLQRRDFAAAPKRESWAGLVPLLLGIFIFIVAARAQQARYALVALPLLIGGAVWFVWGWPKARVAAFPCILLLFMVPVGFILGHTAPLQNLVASVVAGVSNLVGVGVNRDGVSLIAKDGSFHCEVAGGCSGVRSLIAMTMLSLLYAHFNERTTWKKFAIFSATLPFTVIGNIVRVFTIVLVSKWFGQDVGTGPWHDISGFIITIPIAVGAMIGFHELLELDWSGWVKTITSPAVPRPRAAATTTTPSDTTPTGETKPPASSPISYDY
jgi:exosortase